ncbi:unnamed protein product, partial [Protopolystoma xenopodis]
MMMPVSTDESLAQVNRSHRTMSRGLIRIIQQSSLPDNPLVSVEQVVCCRLSQIQAAIYSNLVDKKAVEVAAMTSVAARDGRAVVSSLASITQLKKLCNHPDLVFDKIVAGTDGFDGALQYFPDKYTGCLLSGRGLKPELS